MRAHNYYIYLPRVEVITILVSLSLEVLPCFDPLLPYPSGTQFTAVGRRFNVADDLSAGPGGVSRVP